MAGLKRRGQVVQAAAIRGSIFARVMVAARDARLSGAEWSVLTTIALQLQHLGRTRGMMTFESLADDCMVTPRTVRNALRTLKASGFVNVTIRNDESLSITLAKRFSPKATVPANASPVSPRRSAARKKISRSDPLLPPSPRYKATPLPPTTPKRRNIPATAGAARRESNGGGLRPGMAKRHFDGPVVYGASRLLTAVERVRLPQGPRSRPAYDWPDHGPSRKRAAPDPSG